jgi:hypothetical protein
VLDILVAQVSLQSPRIMPLVRQRKATGVLSAPENGALIPLFSQWF